MFPICRLQENEEADKAAKTADNTSKLPNTSGTITDSSIAKTRKTLRCR